MKLIIDIPDEEYKRMTEESIFSTHVMITAIQNGTSLDDVKFHIEHMACKQYEHRLTLDRQEVIKILNNIGKESEGK